MLTGEALGMRFACIAAALALTACGSRPAPSPPTALAAASPVSALGYVLEAARADLFEIEASRIAAARAGSDRVRAFAQTMVTEHTATTNLMKSTLALARLGAPEAVALDARRQRFVDQLNAAPAGDAFDRLYVQQQLMAHQEALAAQQAYARSGANPQLRAMAGQVAPKVAQHLAMLREIAASL